MLKYNEQVTIKQTNIQELKELNKENLFYGDKLQKIKKENIDIKVDYEELLETKIKSI